MDSMSQQQQKIEHLKLIQGVVTRMAGNSAQVKTWSVSLVTAVVVFTGLSDNPHWMIALGGLVPVVAFCLMDAQYLRLERCYRKLYAQAVKEDAIELFDMDFRPYMSSVDSVWRVIFSWSVIGFYGSLFAIVLVVFLFLAL